MFVQCLFFFYGLCKPCQGVPQARTQSSDPVFPEGRAGTARNEAGSTPNTVQCLSLSFSLIMCVCQKGDVYTSTYTSTYIHIYIYVYAYLYMHNEKPHHSTKILGLGILLLGGVLGGEILDQGFGL